MRDSAKRETPERKQTCEAMRRAVHRSSRDSFLHCPTYEIVDRKKRKLDLASRIIPGAA